MQEDMMEQLEQAKEQVAFFAEKYSEWHGTGHLILARHAAFPVSVTVDLLYQLWANFKAYPDEEGDQQVIPMLAVSDLLLSSLFRQTGRDIYEMQPEIRAYLLHQLKKDDRFGEPRILQLASFLYRYIREQPDRPEWKNFKEAQLWTALLTIDPERAAQHILQELVNRVSNAQVNSSIGIANIAEAFAKDNDAFARHIADSLQSNTEPVEKQPATATGGAVKKLILADKAVPGSTAFPVNLPPYISNRLKGIKTVVSARAVPEKDIPGIVYGLFTGISEYTDTSLRLQSADKDAINLSQCLQEYGLIEKENVHLLLNADVTRSSFQSQLENLLTTAGSNDFVLVYFSGHALNSMENSSLIMHDVIATASQLSDPLMNSISASQFNNWINRTSRTHPTVILILDTHSGSRKWLNETDPKQVLIMATHLTQHAGKVSSGGFFTTALINAIQESKGLITYRNLYKNVCENLQQNGAQLAEQTPLFSTQSWDNYIFSHRQINHILPVQMLLNDCGYTVKADGIEGPATERAKQQFLKDLGVPYDGDIRFCLELKRTIQRQQKITVLIISSDMVSSVLSQMLLAGKRDEIWIDLHYPLERLFEDSPGAKSSTLQQPKFYDNMSFTEKLMTSCSIIIFLEQHTLKDNHIYQNVEKLLDMAFALNKQVLLFSDGNDIPGDFETRYRSILWDSVHADFLKNQTLVLQRFNHYRTFLENLLTINRKKSIPALEATYSEAVEIARQTGKLDLSNQKLQEIPDIVFSLTNLEELHAEGNQFVAIPAAIAQLTRLRMLNLNGSSITSLPPELMELQQLETLMLSNTDLEELPEDIDKLVSLQKLYIHSTPLVTLPDALARLKKLQILDARETHILNVPAAVLRGKNAPKKFSTYVNSFHQNRILPVIVLMMGKDISVREILGTGFSGNLPVQVYKGAVTPVFLFEACRKGMAEHCLVYIENDDNLLDQFALQGQKNRQRIIKQFFMASQLKNINLIYNGSQVGQDKLFNELVKTPCINAVITLGGSLFQEVNKVFIRLFIQAYARGVSIIRSYQSVTKDILMAGAKIPDPYYKLYKRKNFIDVSLPVNMLSEEKIVSGTKAKKKAAAFFPKKSAAPKSAKRK